MVQEFPRTALFAELVPHSSHFCFEKCYCNFSSLSLELERSTCAGGWLSEGGGGLLAETGPRRTTRSRKRDVLCTVQRRERLRYCTFVHEPAPRRLHPYSHLSEGGEGSPWGQRSEAEHAIKENSSERYFAGSR